MSAAGQLTQPVGAEQFAGYRAWIDAGWPAFRDSKVAADRVRLIDDYLTLLPTCTLARCPYCDGIVAEPFDTFSLNGLGWLNPSTGYGWLRGRNSLEPLAPTCPHVRIVAWYLHLEGRTPDDLFVDKYLQVGPEVPSIMCVPMRAPDAVAVIHPLPVGRWDDDAPAHRYTTWFVSYFTATPDTFAEATRDWGVHYGLVEYMDVDFHLDRWARDGRLRWLADDATLAPEGATFPWAGIEGDRFPLRVLTHEGAERPRTGAVDRIRDWLRSR